MTMRRDLSPPVRTARAGFTLAEVMIAISVAGILAMLAVPKIGVVRDRMAVRAARQELTAAIDAARAAATQRGRSAHVLVRGDSAVAVVDTGPPGLAATGSRTVLARGSFHRAYGARVVLASPGDSIVTYDGRGMASPRLGRVVKYVVALRASRDSVCVSSLGNILPQECAP